MARASGTPAQDLVVSRADAVLAGLDPQQREVAAAPWGPMCVLAGAGTGKTRAITSRIAYGVHSGAYQPGRVLALTFTARAAGEMRTRLRALGVGGVSARTFHAAALRQLHYFWPRAVGGAAPEVLSSKAGVVGEAVGRLGLDLDRAAVRDLAAEIEWAKVSLLTPDTYAEAARTARRDPAGLDLTAMARIFEGYEQRKGERGVVDFEDVLLLTAGILDERADIASVVRDQYRVFVVDEYQDVNALQQRLLELWLGRRQDVCVVGDPAQTIYSFTGATPAHLLGFPRRYPGTQVVRLVRNYRSTPQIVGLANHVLRLAARHAPPGSGPREPPLVLQAQAPAGPPPTLRAYPDDTAEAEAIAATAAELVRSGRPAAQMAVLFRVNAQSEAFEAALSTANVPYLLRGGERFFARHEVRAATALLRGAVRGDDGRVPLPQLVRDVLTGTGWSPQPPASGGAVRERWESLTALAALADELVATSAHARLGDLVRELDERAAAQHAPVVPGVTLASLHAAKGLEWDVVFLAGLSDGLLPIRLAEDPAALEEERRLFYVGLTRARRELHLSYALARSPGGRAGRAPSRFLDGAAQVLGLPDPHPTRANRREASRASRLASACRACGRALSTAAERKVGRCGDCPPGYDPADFEALRTWRTGVARESALPAYVVFTDATLAAIAEARPRSLGDLSAIPGVGARKLERYGPAVLEVLGGAEPAGARAERRELNAGADPGS